MTGSGVPHEDPAAQLVLGTALARQRRFAEALPHLLAVERQDLDQDAMGRAAFVRALILRHQGDEAGALELLRTASVLASSPEIQRAVDDPAYGLDFVEGSAQASADVSQPQGEGLLQVAPEPRSPAPVETSADDAATALRLFAAGVDALGTDKELALTKFNGAVALDPWMADAWLGVHAAGGDPGKALEMMKLRVDLFGEARAATGRSLASSAPIGAYVNLRLEDRDQLRLCYACHATVKTHYALAASSLRHVGQPAYLAAFVGARLEQWRGNVPHSLDLAREALLGNDQYVEVEARLMLGIGLARMRRFEEATAELVRVEQQQVTPAAIGEAECHRGLILRAQGDEEGARRLMRQALEHTPGFDLPRIALDDPGHGLAFVTPEGEIEGTPAPSVPVPALVPAEDLAEILAELDRWVGLGDIKRQVRVLMAQVKGNLARARHGIAQDRLTEHLVFVGPPGTGKTSLARLVARLYHALGVLQRPTVVEADRSSLVGQHLGSTALKTSAIIDQAMGGVLFIDEAYSLEQEGLVGGDAFGSEAVDTLVKRMEDERDRLVVIVAGYADPMTRFLKSNEGFASRFTSTLRFPSYDAAELLEIATGISMTSGALLGEGTTDLLLDHFERVVRAGDVDRLGNGRLARNVIEKAQRERDFRLFSGVESYDHTIEQLQTIETSDVFGALAEGGSR